MNTQNTASSTAKTNFWGKKKQKKSEYIVEIIVNVIILYVANMLLAWHVPYLTAEWTASLWILNLSLVVGIASAAFLLFYDRNWFKSILKIVSNVLGVVFQLTVLYVFPLDFSSLSYGTTLELIIKVILVIGIIGTIISIIVNFFRFFIPD